MIIVLLSLLALASHSHWATAKDNFISKTSSYPLPNQGNIQAHDPNIFFQNDSFYLFRTGHYLTIHKSSSLSGPWHNIGTVLSGPSIIEKPNSTRPWAPTVIQWNSTFYCFYCVSEEGKRNSSIGVATTDTLDSNSHGDEKGSWIDHGALIETGGGNLSTVYPYNESNAIDPAFIMDVNSHQPYLIFGSYWSDIWQVPLTLDLLAVVNSKRPDAVHLAFLPEEGHTGGPLEGSFMTYTEPYYYLWLSYGQCCRFERTGFPKKGNEYSILVGRSKDVRGPFVDKSGRNLMDGGGTTVYGSNHGVVYAPGGPGVLPGNNRSRPDILYYHYLNKSIGFRDSDAQLGWNYLDYIDGWPVVRGYHNTATRFRFSYKMFALAVFWLYIWS